MDKQEVQIDEGISLVDIFKLLLSRIKFLIVVVLIAGIAGGAFAFVRSNNVDYYGTKADYYINPTREDVVTENAAGVYGTYSASVMDGIVRLLNSESFAEQLLLDGKTLPEKDKYGKNAKEKAELNALIDSAQSFVDAFNAAKTAYDDAVKEKTVAYEVLTTATKTLNTEWTKWRTKEPENFTTNAFSEGVYNALVNPEKYTTLNDAVAAYLAADNDYTAAELTIENNKTTLSNATAAMNENVDAVMAKWNQTPQYKAQLSKYQNAVSFSYLKEDTTSTEVSSSARCFIYVNINVLNDKKFAEDLFECVQRVLPAYVESNMPPVTGYTGTNCRRISRNDDIQITNPLYTTKQVIKLGLIAGVGALVAACLILILLDRSDKRLRDVDIITKKFNLPVLGIIPTIETDADKNTAKKTTEVK